MMWFRFRIILFSFLLPLCLSAQIPWKDVPVDSLTDLTDIVQRILHSNNYKPDGERKKNHIQISVFPAVGYTLQTGFAAVVSTNAVIPTSSTMKKIIRCPLFRAAIR